MIVRCGLLYRDYADEADDVFEIYRNRNLIAARSHISESLLNGKTRRTSIHFIGVWDTVGALGIPLSGHDFNILTIWRNQFHDVALSNEVHYAYHAIAMDEMRPSFVPTLWQVPFDRPEDRPVEQIWFRGVHSDVGGGYAATERYLANITLRWMMQKANHAGLRIDKEHLETICNRTERGNVHLHDSLGRQWRMLGAWPRAFPIRETDAYISSSQRVAEAFSNRGIEQVTFDMQRSVGTLHSTVRNIVVSKTEFGRVIRGLNRHIRVPRLGSDETFTVHGEYWWNRTAIALEAGVTYEIKCTGQWNDGGIKCTADGWDHWNVLFEMLKRFRRSVDANWFAAIGVVNSYSFFRSREQSVLKGLHGLLLVDPTELTRRQITLGRQCRVTPLRDGLLYVFPNDLWWMFGNNSGALELTVKRYPSSTHEMRGFARSRPSVEMSTTNGNNQISNEIRPDGKVDVQPTLSFRDERKESRLGLLGLTLGLALSVVLIFLSKQDFLCYQSLIMACGTIALGWWVAPVAAMPIRLRGLVVPASCLLALIGLALTGLHFHSEAPSFADFMVYVASYWMFALGGTGLALTMAIVFFAAWSKFRWSGMSEAPHRPTSRDHAR